ncbi:PHP domain-containing protein [archaeon]|jgi:3',5'-nucleoside bisphosphate phosphatase|nr:PHP domain-containing protein [archaeon]
METQYIDLHSHSIYSDGDLLPEENIRVAAINGLDIFTISDHDNYRGYFQALKIAQDLPITLIPGTEFTAKKYHLLALNYNPFDKEFQQFCEYSRQIQEGEGERRVQMLQGYNVPINMKKLKNNCPSSRIGKGNIIRTLMTDPECREYIAKNHKGQTMGQIVDFYIGDNGLISNLDNRRGVRESDAIAATHKAGGIIGVAHITKETDSIEDLDKLVAQGIDFMEVQPRLLEKFNYQKFIDHAEKINLPMSYGSDYHGPSLVKRTMLSRDSNILHENLARILDKGFVKIDR